MAFLRTTKILEEMNLLFEESDFELRLNKKLRKVNKYKLQPVFNINGTVTVVASHRNGSAVYITFSGDGIVELWPHQGVFLIDREKYAPAEIRKQFRDMLENEYRFEFTNGGHSALVGEIRPDMLLHPRIIPQIFKVFCAEDFKLQMRNCNVPTHSSRSNRLDAHPLPDGRLGITVGIENLEHEHSYAKKVIVLFDGSSQVGICNLCDIHKLDDLTNTDKLHMVAIEDARQVLLEQYGASFDEEWRMNEPPIFDFCGIPYDSDYWSMTVNDADLDGIDDSDNELVCGFLPDEEMLPRFEIEDE